MGGRIFDLPREHLDELARMIDALPTKPAELRAAEAQLAETAGLRRIARMLDIPDDVFLAYDSGERIAHWATYTAGSKQAGLELLDELLRAVDAPNIQEGAQCQS